MPKIERRIKLHIERKGAASINQIAEYLGISPYKVQRTMEYMTKKGKILKRPPVVGLNQNTNE